MSQVNITMTEKEYLEYINYKNNKNKYVEFDKVDLVDILEDRFIRVETEYEDIVTKESKVTYRSSSGNTWIIILQRRNN